MINDIYYASVKTYDFDLVYNSIEKIIQHYKLSQKLNTESTVLLKPNLLAKHAPEKNVTTHPVILEAVICALLKIGIKSENILIMDSPGGTASKQKLISSYEVCGYANLNKKYGVKLYTDIALETISTNGVVVKEFLVTKPILEYDFVINLPKFKSHAMMGLTGSVKNMFGVISGLKKSEFHFQFTDKERFSDMLLDLFFAIRCDLSIMDGIQGMHKDGPASGQTKEIGVLLAGENAVYLDYLMAYLTACDLKSLPLINAFIRRGLINEDINIKDFIIGDVEKFKLIDDFVLPASYSINFKDHAPRALSWAIPPIEKLLSPKPYINKTLCIGCKKCEDICPKKVITMHENKAKIALKNCIKCFCCHEVCPVKAIDIKRSSFFNF